MNKKIGTPRLRPDGDRSLWILHYPETESTREQSITLDCEIRTRPSGPELKLRIWEVEELDNWPDAPVIRGEHDIITTLPGVDPQQYLDDARARWTALGFILQPALTHLTPTSADADHF